MVTVDMMQKTKNAANRVTAQVFSSQYGFSEMSDYATLPAAKAACIARLKGDADYDHYEIYTDDGVIAGSYGYDMRSAIVDLRAYRNCCRADIGGWEMNAEGFRLLVQKGYIVPSDRHLDIECGYWYITDKFRKIGNYLVKRRWR